MEKIESKTLEELWLPSHSELSNWGFNAKNKLNDVIEEAAREGMEYLLESAEGTVHSWDEKITYCLFTPDNDLIFSDDLDSAIIRGVIDEEEKQNSINHLKRIIKKLEALSLG